MKKLLLFFCFSSLFFVVDAQDLTEYEKGFLVNDQDTILYRILYPENFNPAKKYPVVFFLHGVGERGNDNEKQLRLAGKFFLKDEMRKKFPAIVIFPQCPVTDYWPNTKFALDSTGKPRIAFVAGGKPTKIMNAFDGLIDDILTKSFSDKRRVYVGGLSLGAMGTYEILRRKPNTFAAAFAICGGDNLENVDKYKNIPLWIFHGEKDNVVNPAFSIAIAERLKVLGDEVKLSLYPDVKHNSWINAFAEPDLLPWLFSHKKIAPNLN